MKLYRKFLTLAMVAFLTLFMGMNFLMEDKKFSEEENRVLQKKPSFTWEDLKSGKFTADYEKYITDQFPFRNFWVSVKAMTEAAMQRKDNNGVYLGKDGYLLQKLEPVDKELLAKNIEAVNLLGKNNPQAKISFLLAPNSVKILEDKLPPFAAREDQLAIIKDIKNSLDSNINFVEVYEELQKHKEEYIYYKTDHHWTTLGAYYAYKSLGLSLEYNPLNLEDFNIEKVTDNFYGTLYSKGNYRFAKPDYIEIFKPRKEISSRVEYLDEGKTSDNLYEFKHLEKKDKYSLFLDGNHALLNIKTRGNTGKKLLVLKDSYAHSLVPFLVNHYDEIHMIDLRYFNMGIGQYIKQFEIEEILLLYNVSSFTEDSSLIKMKLK